MGTEVQHHPEASALLDVQVWSDVVCPWCWIGEARLRQALNGAGLASRTRITMRSYQLDPVATRGPVIPMLAAKHGLTLAEARAMTDEVRSIGDELGLTMDFDVARSAPTGEAHQLLQLARRRGLDPDLMTRLHRAHFTEGADVSDRSVLTHAAGDVGIDEHEAEAVLETGVLAAGVMADREDAWRLGVRGVPFFVLAGRVGVSGAQPVERLTDAIERATQALAR